MDYFTTMKDGKINPVHANNYTNKALIRIINSINSKEDFLKFVNEDWFYDNYFIFDEDRKEWFVIAGRPHLTPDGEINQTKIRHYDGRPRMETMADYMEKIWEMFPTTQTEIEKIKREHPNIRWDHTIRNKK